MDVDENDNIPPEPEPDSENKPLEKPRLRDKIKGFIHKIKINVLTLYLSMFRVPWYKKILPFIVLIYALSPIDLVPDFIPILGYLDDLILIPLGLWLCRLIIPRDVWQACRKDAEQGVKIKTSYKVLGIILILLIWAAIILAIVFAVIN